MAGQFRISITDFRYSGVLSYYDHLAEDWQVLSPRVSKDYEWYSRYFPPNAGPTPHRIKIVLDSNISIEDYEYTRMSGDSDPVYEYPDNRTVIINYPEGFPYTENNKTYKIGIWLKSRLFSVAYSGSMLPFSDYKYLTDVFNYEYIQTNFRFNGIDDLVPYEGIYDVEYYPKNVIELPDRALGFSYFGETRFDVYDEDIGDTITYILVGWTLGDPMTITYLNSDNYYEFNTDISFSIRAVFQEVEKGALKMWTGTEWARVN